jgi:transcriptional regulator with XRE-family HTH domain
MDNQKLIGERIKEARERARLTQEQLGSKVGFSAMGISHLEKGQRGVKIEHLDRIADALELDVSYFLTPVSGGTSASYPNTFYGRINGGSDMSDSHQVEINTKISEFDKYIESKFENKE